MLLGDDANQVDQPAVLTPGGFGTVVDAQCTRSAISLQGFVPVVTPDVTLSSIDTLSLSARQRLSGSVMLIDTVALVDFRFRFQGVVLLHYELVGYRSDNDTTVSCFQANSNSLRLFRADSDLFRVLSFVFSGHKFSVVSLEQGGKLYTCTAGGQILAPDVPWFYIEVRETSRSSTAVRGRLTRSSSVIAKGASSCSYASSFGQPSSRLNEERSRPSSPLRRSIYRRSCRPTLLSKLLPISCNSLRHASGIFLWIMRLSSFSTS